MSTARKISPPKWPLRFLRFFIKEEFLEEIEGDMEELFAENAEKFSPTKAKAIYTWEMLKLLRPVLLKNLKPVSNFNQYAMLQNYFKIGWRNLLKKKAYSAINIFGLGLGMACCFLIFLYVQDERSYDDYHANKDRIYRLIHGPKPPKESNGVPNAAWFWVWGNAPVGPALKRDFPEIDKIVQFSGRSDILLTHGNNTFQEDGVFFMDSTVFDIFTWELTKGNPKTALAAPYSIVLTETTARKYFGDEDPLGKVLKGSESAGRSDAGDYTVTGVMKDVPLNSHFRFNALLSMATFRKSVPDVFDNPGYVDFYTYFLVNDKFNEAAFNEKIPAFMNRFLKDPTWDYTIVVEPMDKMYLGTEAQRQPGEVGSLSNIYVFSVIGIFILVIAIINFMNLSTARSMERSKEVGIRKSVGAERGSLVTQFLGESLIIVLMSVLVATGIVTVALPYMDTFTGKELQVLRHINPQTTSYIFIAVVVIALVAGSYPALVLSAFRPALVLKSGGPKRSSGINLRKILVVFQFSLSIALIAATFIIYSQIDLLLNRNLGFDKEQMLVLDYNYDGEVNKISETLKNEIEVLPGVISSAYSRSVPGSYYPHAGTEIQTADGEMKMIGQPIFQVGIDFIPHFGLQLIAGRSYSREHPYDSGKSLVINESCARQYGYTNPADAVGKKFSQWGREGQVIGVVKDFNFTSLHNMIDPLTLPFSPYSSRYLTVKVKSENLNKTINDIKSVWTRLAPHRPFLYSFLDEDFNRQYQSDFIFRKLFTTFSCLAIFIACLGLLGLATYTTELRTKEIGIRKVLGANTSNIIVLLSGAFIKLVLISIIVAAPLSWYGMNKWLEGFAYRIEINWWIFVVAGMVALLIAVFTISFQSIKAALVNPVKSLKTE